MSVSKRFGSIPHGNKVKTEVFTYHFFNGSSSLSFYLASGRVRVAAKSRIQVFNIIFWRVGNVKVVKIFLLISLYASMSTARIT
jgi:hypothetical protein